MSEMSKGETPTQKSGKGGIKLVVVGIVAVIAVLVVTIVVLASKLADKPAVEEPKEKRSVLTPENVEEVMEEFLTPEENGYVPEYFKMVQNTEWTFPSGSAASIDAYVENDAENETPVYFDVVEDSTGETVYSSPILALGAKIENFKLDKVLDKGDYDCTIIYHLVDDDQNELTTVEVTTIIHVLE